MGCGHRPQLDCDLASRGTRYQTIVGLNRLILRAALNVDLHAAAEALDTNRHAAGRSVLNERLLVIDQMRFLS